MKGYLAFDENIKGKRPGVLVVHEWWDIMNMSVNVQDVSRNGYTALAIDVW